MFFSYFRLTALLFLFFIVSLSHSQSNPDFTLATNGVTCLCPNAAIGDTGTLTINGEVKTFTKRTRSQLDAFIATDQNDPEIALTCTSGITDMSNLFDSKASFNQDISTWDVSSVTDMGFMFFSASSFNQTLNDWDVSAVTNMDTMFSNATMFNSPLDNWDVSNVTNMYALFASADAFSQPLNMWNVSSVLNMAEVFNGIAYNQPLDNWDVSSVTTLQGTFRNTTAFNQPLDTWDVSSVTNMQGMFSGAQSFNQNISGWCVEQIPSVPNNFATNSPLQDNFKPNWAAPCGSSNPDFTIAPNGVTCLCPNAAIGDTGTLTINGVDKTFTKRTRAQLDALIAADQTDSEIAFTCTSGITDMSNLFKDKTAFDQDILSWDVSSVTDMKLMFESADIFNQPLNNWDVSNVTNMTRLFNGASAFNQPLDNWGVSNVTAMVAMFTSATNFNQSLNNWDVSNVGDMEFMFNSAVSFDQPLNDWDVSNLGGMQGMFWGASSFNQPLDNWELTGIGIDFSSMFKDAISFNQSLNNWDVSNAVDMYAMFEGATSFNQPLNNWNISNNIWNLSNIFKNANSFDQPLNNWDVSSVTNMDEMFSNASAFNQDISNWCVENIPSEPSNFAGGSVLQDSFKPNWGASCNGSNPDFTLAPNGVTCLCPNAAIGDTGTLNINGVDKTFTKRSRIQLDILIDADPQDPEIALTCTSGITDMSQLFNGTSSFNQDISSWDVSNVTDMEYMFTYITVFNSPLNNWDVSNVTNMEFMFAYAEFFNQPLDNWDVSNVTTMESMFDDALNFNQPLNQWDVSNVTNMQSMFGGASNFDQPLNQWDVSNVTNMQSMLGGSNFNQPLNQWDVSNVTNMRAMLAGLPNFDQPLNNWDVSNVINMQNMFFGASNFNQPLNDWDVSNVSSMNSIFNNAISFNQPLDNWDVSNVTAMDYMFRDASSFNQNLSGWCVENISSFPSLFANGSSLVTNNYPNFGAICILPEITNTPVNLSQCGDFTITQNFDLSQNNLSTLSVTNISDAAISYHNSQGDADSGTNQIIDPLSYIPAQNQEQVFIRIERTSDTSVYITTNFNIEIFNVESNPVDDITSNLSSSNQTQFDLTQQNSTIFGSNQDDTTHNITYYNSQADADSGTNPIVTPDNYTNTTNPETIYARIENTNNPSCYETLSFELIVLVSNPDFYLAPNGVTCMCPNAAIGDTGILDINGELKTFTKRSRIELDALILIDEQNPEIALSCTSGITDISFLFFQNQNFNQDISSWDVSSVTNMQSLFNFTDYNQPLNDWDVSNVINMSYIFSGADNFNQPLDNWDVSSVLDMSYMFTGAESFNQSINTWNVSNVTNMTAIFSNALSYNQPLDNWDVSSVSAMQRMFDGASSFDQPLNNWDVSNITNMTEMFRNANSFNQPLNSWNVSNVTNLSKLFLGADLFNQPLNDWDVSNVTNMQSIFTSTNYNQPLNIWNVSSVINMSGMFVGTPFNQPLDSWDVSSVIYMAQMFDGASSFDQPLNNWDVSNVTNMFRMFANTTFNQPLNSWNVSSVTNMSGMFDNALLFDQSLDNWDVSSVSTMQRMFAGASSFDQLLNNWDVSSVNIMNDMFRSTNSFNQPLNNWNVSNVNDMIGMFAFASSFNQDISEWCVEQIPNEPALFAINSPLNSSPTFKPNWGSPCVGPPIIVNQPQDLTQCGDFTLSQTFDLTQIDQNALGIVDPAENQLSYHNTQADADANLNPISNTTTYPISTNQENIFIRVERITNTDLYVTTSFNIEIFDVEANPANDIIVCGQTGNTGQLEFDLTQQNTTIFGANQDVTTHSISYHNTQADADGGSNPIVSPDTYTNTSNPETIWARVQNNNEPTCYALVSFDLGVTEEPEILNTPLDLSECGDFTGTQIFDLTQNDVTTLGILNPAETQLSYYNTQADADASTNAIANPTAYNPSSNPEQIFIRAENTSDSSCYTTASFNIEIFDVEANPVNDIVVCSQTGNTGQLQFDLTQQNTTIFGANQDVTTHSVSYHNTQADADGGSNPIGAPGNYANTSNPETIWARVQNNNEPTCYVLVSFDLGVTEEPEIVNAPQDLSECGDFTGTQTFDLTQNDVTALGILNPTETQLSYYNTQADADASTNAIANPSTYNPSNNQGQIFIRAENTSDLSCYTTASFNIEIFDVKANLVGDIEVPAANLGDNQTQFDLTQQNAVIFGANQDSTTHNISYFNSLGDANSGTNPISTPDNYTNSANPETVWARVENSNNSSCFAITDFLLIVTDPPSNPNFYIASNGVTCMCPDATFGETGVLTINGEQKQFTKRTRAQLDAIIAIDESDPEIALTCTSGITNMSNLFDGVFNQNIEFWDVSNVTDMSFMFNGGSFNQPINTWDVSNVTNMASMFRNASSFNQSLNSWDVSNVTDMSSIFRNATAFNQSVNAWDVSNVSNMNRYFEDASSYNQPLDNWEVSNISSMLSMFKNATQFNQDISTWCVQQISAEPFEFSLNSPLQSSFMPLWGANCSLPEITNAPQDLSQCGDFTLTQVFDLTVNNEISLGVFNPFDVNFTYHNLQADADNSANPILSPDSYNPLNNFEQLYIRIENGDTPSNYITTSFTIEVLDVEANPVNDITVCSQTGNTGQTQFDLTQQNTTILGANQDATTHSISYHNTQADADGGSNPIGAPDNYTNTSNPETIWARVQNNTDPNCYALVSFDLGITEEPEIVNTPQDLSECGDFTGTQTFDLTQNDVIALGVLNPTETQLSYYTTQADADATTNAIANPTAYNQSNNPEQIFIRAENTSDSSCYTTASFNIEIFDVEANPVNDIVVCSQTGNTGQLQFDLTQQNTTILGANQDATTHSISYFNTQADADGGSNPIGAPDNYTNTSNPETIWARVQNNTEPNCYALVSFDLGITEEPEIVNTPQDLSECGDFTGTQTFDLTQNDVIALGILNPLETELTYYNSQADADASTNAIANPTAYNPSNNPEQIFIRAENNSDSSCYTTASFNIEIFDVEANIIGDIFMTETVANSGQAEFDLTQQNSAIYGPNQDDTSHSLSYHTSQVDASSNINPIATPNNYTNTSNPQTIWARVTNLSNTSCFSIVSFNLVVNDLPPNPNFFIGTNGITCMCPDASFGETGTLTINGETKTFTKRTRAQLDALIINDELDPEIALTCTSGITDMSNLVDGLFNQNIEFWDVSNVLDMSFMFSGSDFNQPVNVWDVSNVTDMTGMFKDVISFNQPLDNWNVSSVTSMAEMFSNASSFNQALNIWDVSNVTNMFAMFKDAISFNQPLSDWNVSSVINMDEMYRNATLFNQNISSWCVEQFLSIPFEFDLGSALQNSFMPLWGISCQSIVWFGTVDNDWLNPNNWNINTVPDSNDDVVINATTNLPIISSSTVAEVNNLNVLNNSELQVDGILKIVTNLINDGSITFVSNLNSTGQFDEFNGIITGTGDVIVERFIPAQTNNRRGFRFLSSSVDSDGSIFENWQENGASPAGYGTHITGSVNGDNGFDANASGNPSMFIFDNLVANATNAQVPIANTDINTLIAGEPYLNFIRGDRNYNLFSNPLDDPNSDVILRASGSLLTGNFTPVISSLDGFFSVVGNPYQSIVDFSGITKNGDLKSNLLFIWNANAATQGAFEVIDASITPSQAMIQPGQSFYIQNSTNVTNTPSLVFTELAKNPSGLVTDVFNTDQIAKADINLYNTNDVRLDVVKFRFENVANNGIDDLDGGKLFNPTENIASSTNNNTFSIERREIPDPQTQDIIPLFINQYQTTQYEFRLETQNWDNNVQVLLIDNYLNTTTLINGINNYAFIVDTTIPESIASDRFSVSFNNTTLGINDNDFGKEFLLYPNPSVNGTFNIMTKGLNGNTVKVRMRDMLGKYVLTKRLSVNSNGDVRINASNLSSGVYLVELNQDDKKFTSKIIID